MSARLTFLGTGHAMVTKCYNTCFLLEDGDHSLLVDAGGGNGILVQMERAGKDFSRIHHMFVTHSHSDHLLGTAWVIRKIASLMRADRYEGTFTVYCHRELEASVMQLCELCLAPKFLVFLGKRIFLQSVEDGEEVDAVGFPLKFFDIGSEKTKQYGFSAELSDGQKLACLGDEPFHEAGRVYVTDCDWLLSEAFCLYEERERFKPYEKHHTTALEAGETAEKLGVKNLVLYHTEDSDLLHRKERYGREAARCFSGGLWVPDDLETVEL